MKTQRIIYWIATGLLTAMMLFSAGMYFFNYEEVQKLFSAFGFPTYIIYPLAIAKLLGLAVILSRKGGVLVEWAYAGFFFNVVLAFFAHFMIDDGEHIGAFVALVLVMTSYVLGKKVRA